MGFALAIAFQGRTYARTQALARVLPWEGRPAAVRRGKVANGSPIGIARLLRPERRITSSTWSYDYDQRQNRAKGRLAGPDH